LVKNKNKKTDEQHNKTPYFSVLVGIFEYGLE